MRWEDKMKEVVIRKALREDIERIEEIYEEFLDYEAEHGTVTNWIKGVYPTEKNALAGLENDTLGKKFVNFALEYGRKIGCKVMRLDTYEFNEPAAKMYDKMGFRYVGKEKFFFENAMLENLICFEYEL